MNVGRNLTLSKDNNQPFQDGWAMRAEEVRQMLGGIGRNTLYEWVNQGKIPHKRIGRVILFSRKQIQEWLESNEDYGVTR